MDQDTTWYGGRPRPRRHCVKCGPISPQNCTPPPNFLAHVAKWLDGYLDLMKMPLGTEVDLDLDHIVLDGDPAPPTLAKEAQQPPSNFQPMSILATVAHLSYC